MVKPWKCLACKTSSLMKSPSNQPMGSVTSKPRMHKGLIYPICVVLLAVFISTPLYAQQQKERKTKQTVAMSQQVYEELMEIQKQVEAEDYAGAERTIRDMQSGKKKYSPYETAQIWNLSGYLYYLEEKYDDAIRSYQKVLQQPDLPEGLQQSTLKTMAQLYFTSEKYDLALDTIKRLMAVVPEPAADIYMLLGQAYFQMQQYKNALEPIKKAVQMQRDQGRVPRENWLLLLRVIYFELKDYPNMLTVLNELIENYPKDTYILTLAGVYSELGDTKKQLALTEALYEKGYIDPKTHAVNLANLYLLHGIPYKAAVVLQKEMTAKRVKEDMRNLRLLSQAWYQSREDKKAIPPLKKAAAMADDGELYIRLAQSYINLEKWNEAAVAAKKGIDMGGLRRADTANIMYGMALFNQKKLEQAKRVFAIAARDKRSTRTARQWMKYVDSEMRRRDTLDQKLPQQKAREVDALLKANQEQ